MRAPGQRCVVSTARPASAIGSSPRRVRGLPPSASGPPWGIGGQTKGGEMPAMRAVGAGHRLPARAKVRGDSREYLIELDVSNFLESELTVEALGPMLTVRGDQVAIKEDEGLAFRLHERLEE